MLIPPLAFAAFAALALAGMFRDDPDALPTTREGRPAPAIRVEAMAGQPTFDDAALRAGQVTVVNFWASWCPPCQHETPVLRELFRAHEADGLRMVGVSVQEASPEEVRRYVETYDVPYTVAFDGTSAVFQAWRGFGLPTHYLIDGQGIVRAVHYGPLSRDAAEALLATIMPTPTPGASPAAVP